MQTAFLLQAILEDLIVEAEDEYATMENVVYSLHELADELENGGRVNPSEMKTLLKIVLEDL